MKQTKFWFYATILTGITLVACTNEDVPVPSPEDQVESQLKKMTLREKVGLPSTTPRLETSMKLPTTSKKSNFRL